MNIRPDASYTICGSMALGVLPHAPPERTSVRTKRYSPATESACARKIAE